MDMIKSFYYEEDGMGTIEIAIILAALVALALVFREQLGKLWTNIKKSITDNADDAGNPGKDIN